MIEWSANLSTGVEEIDDQHRALIEMIRTLQLALTSPGRPEVQRQTIDSMLAYANKHFDYEEHLMRERNYPEAEYTAHREDHQEFVRTTHSMKERLDDTGFRSALEILTFLSNWLNEHIMKKDRHYAEYFKKQGLRLQSSPPPVE